VRKQQISLKIDSAQIEQGQRLAAAARGAGNPEPEALTVKKIDRLPTQPIAADLANDEALIAGVPDVRVQERGNPSRWFRTALAHDGRDLVVAWQVADPSPWKNSAGQFTHAFIGGDCVDLKLDVPGRGPVRLLVAAVGGKNTAVYFQKTAEAKDNPTTYSVANNVANSSTLDIVRRASNAKITVQSGMTGYTVLLTLPLADLGLQPGQQLRGVVGTIYSDPSGTNRAARLYWMDKSTDLVSDVPSESRIDTTRFGPITVER
jgi:hypothetical protein